MARAGIAPVPHGCPAPGWSSGTGPGCPKESPQPPQGTNSCTLESIIFCRLLEKKYWEGLNLYCKCLHLGHLHACAHIVIITVCQLSLQYEDFRYLQLWRAFCSRPVQKNPKPFHLLASHFFFPCYQAYQAASQSVMHQLEAPKASDPSLHPNITAQLPCLSGS